MRNISNHNSDSTDTLKTVAASWMREVWQRGDVSAIDTLHAPDFIDRSPTGRTPNNEGFKEGVTQLYAAFPDFFAETEDLVIDTPAGKAVIRWSATGTHKGAFMGLPPTGKRITFRGIEILHIQDGRIIERWGEWDGMDLMEQLGLKTTSE